MILATAARQTASTEQRTQSIIDAITKDARAHQGGRNDAWFQREVVTKIAAHPLNAIARATGLSLAACSRIRAGARAPPRAIVVRRCRCSAEGSALSEKRESMATELDSGPPASARPTGTVTFLFSDIEGSTVRWERDHEAMEPALARHDALMRATLEAC